MEESDKGKVVVRISRDLHKRIGKIAEKRRFTNTAMIERAISYFLEDAETSLEALMELVEQQPLLKFHKELINKTFKNSEKSDPETLKDVINFIKKGNVGFYEEISFEELENKVNQLNEIGCMEALVIARINPDKREAGKFKQILEIFRKIKCPSELALLFDGGLGEEFKFMIFILGEKEEKRDGDEQEN